MSTIKAYVSKQIIDHAMTIPDNAQHCMLVRAVEAIEDYTRYKYVRVFRADGGAGPLMLTCSDLTTDEHLTYLVPDDVAKKIAEFDRFVHAPDGGAKVRNLRLKPFWLTLTNRELAKVTPRVHGSQSTADRKHYKAAEKVYGKGNVPQSIVADRTPPAKATTTKTKAQPAKAQPAVSKAKPRRRWAR